MITAGTLLGPYEILEPIGAGGMGEVYKARDTRIGRIVAIKISKEQFSERFEREARAVAALNHPNICTLFDVGPNYLVMEFVEGPTLAEVIKQGPVPVEQAVPIARQIAEAFEEAHDKKVLHRDLKPANVKVTPEGRVKVLDFGLAKTLNNPAGDSGSNPADSPTLTMGMTMMGAILGTAAYMAPEQARGRPVDKRADIWAFGATLFEIFSGHQAFPGDDATDIIAAVVKLEPDYTLLPVDVPWNIRRLIQYCLVKDPRNRLHDISDARIELSHPAEAAPLTGADREIRVELPVTVPTKAGWIAAAIAVLAAAGISATHFREKPPDPQLIRTSILPPEDSSGFVFNANTGGSAISPDGKMLAFVARVKDEPMLFVRPLDSLTARLLPGTAGAARPFWSPDSRNIGFQAKQKLQRIGVNEGAPRVICDLIRARGATWNAEGVIVFSDGVRNSALVRVPASGGMPQPMTIVDAQTERFHYWPQFLPDGKHFLYVIRMATLDKSGIYVGSLDEKPENQRRVRLVDSPYGATYAPGAADPTKGHLLWMQGTSLMAQPFDSGSLRLSGEAQPVTQSIGGTETNGYVDLSAAGTGVLAYGNSNQGSAILVWSDRSGKQSATVAEALPGTFRLSPDGNSVVLTRSNGSGTDYWLMDLVRNTPTRFTFGTGSAGAVWSPDGKEVVYSAALTMWRKPASGAGEPTALVKEFASPLDWSPDAKFILYQGPGEVWVLPMDPDGKPGKPFSFLKGVGNIRFSPGVTSPRWVAYGSMESGMNQVYLQDFPSKRAKYQVSTDGGSFPVWSRDGKELFYISQGKKLMSVAVRITGDAASLGKPQLLFDVPEFAPFDVQPDGKRFLMMTLQNQDRRQESLTVVQNWQAALGK